MTILGRHLAGQVLVATATVTILLLLVALGGRFTGYLADAVQGRIGGDAVLLVLLMRLPEFLALLLPPGLYIGMALVWSRLVGESELIAWRAAGVSTWQWLRWALLTAAGPALLVAMCVLWLAPWCAQNIGAALLASGGLTEFDAVRAGRFVTTEGGLRMAWADAMSDDRRELSGVFVAEQQHGRLSAAGLSQTTLASRARRVIDAGTGSRFLLLEAGVRYEGTAGEPGYRIVRFDALGQRVHARPLDLTPQGPAASSTVVLLTSERSDDRAEWLWRLTQVLLTPVAAVLVLLVSPVTARGGRNLSIGGGIAVYLLVFAAMTGVRDMVAREVIVNSVGLLLVALVPALAIGAHLGRERLRSWR